MRIIIPFLFILALALQAGCSKDTRRPVDMPELFPVSIAITAEGKPLEGATVTLIGKTRSKYSSCSAVTDASGVALLKTYTYEGVPLGQYIVTVEKRGVEGAKEVQTPEGLTDSIGGKIYQYIDSKYTNERSSPFSIDVTEKGGQETFEVGKPVHVFLGDVAV